MNTAAIINELPKLTKSERRKIIKYLIELEEDQDAIQFAYESTNLAFQMLDKMEESD
jgi:mRNA-degrading endonuclease RelE of RelBE toxin-antitoxin system